MARSAASISWSARPARPRRHSSPSRATPVIPLGEQVVGPGQSLILSGTEGPGVQAGLSARPVPVALAEGPLTVTQMPGSQITVPVKLAPGGTLAVSEIGAGPVGYSMTGTSVVVPGADHARSIVLAWRRAAGPPPAVPAPLPLEATTALDGGKPVNFDLDDKMRSFLLNVATGGLYRVETTGRLHTTGKIATAFIPDLGEADGNGVGQNMLLQQVLRAGRYRVSVSAQESAGHLGLDCRPRADPGWGEAGSWRQRPREPAGRIRRILSARRVRPR